MVSMALVVAVPIVFFGGILAVVVTVVRRANGAVQGGAVRRSGSSWRPGTSDGLAYLPDASPSSGYADNGSTHHGGHHHGGHHDTGGSSWSSGWDSGSSGGGFDGGGGHHHG
ncbi:hypothetical protein [Streptacidiphilus rugosus]|uniref:hypothetical protein n=1 Tax=Streptacidiphilus rugosus TaxID=405783 RepID=UPI00055F3784|nr:hypothetical protein [Streptacidiphilus rugosus]